MFDSRLVPCSWVSVSVPLSGVSHPISLVVAGRSTRPCSLQVPLVLLLVVDPPGLGTFLNLNAKLVDMANRFDSVCALYSCLGLGVGGKSA
jgi:hypothetical protein